MTDHEHEWGEWGAVYHGGHSKWRMCKICPATESKGVCSCPECNPDPAEIPPQPHPCCGSTADSWYDRSICAPPCGMSHDRCADCGTALGGCLNDTLASQVDARRRGLPMAVVYTAGERDYELLVAPGAAVVVRDGGILVQHESGEVTRILSVRPLFPGEVPHAAEAEAQHQDR